MKIPDQRTTRQSIIDRFNANVADLSARLNGPTVRGDVSLTTDVWSAGNHDAYMAVTGHAVEEVSPGDWRLRSFLLGFTQMNKAHTGVALGRALYRIARRYKIEHKVCSMSYVLPGSLAHRVIQVGWVTSDNASNNITMLTAFENLINKSKRRVAAGTVKWDKRTRHIR